MTRFGSGLSSLLCMGVLAGWMGASAAAPAAPSEEDVATAKMMHEQLARSFVLPKALPLDPALRTAADAIGAAHLARMKTLLPAWVQEERSLQPADKKGRGVRAHYAAMARMLNELAYWHLEPGDADYEQATLEVLKTSPQVCLTGEDPRHVDFSSRILRIQAMPAARRQAVLASEARLLERWGKPRPAAAPWPAILPQDAAMNAIRQIQAGGKRPAGALSPALAWKLLAERSAYAALPTETSCALKQWWLQESLRQGQSAGDALTAFRYATLVTAAKRFGNESESVQDDANPAAQDKPPYPKFASHFGVTGTTFAIRRFDAAGKATHASVSERTIAVPGIRGVRPIAFEDSFDAPTVAQALKRAPDPASGSMERFQMVWSLAD